MRAIASIVEGDGEVAALPVLLRRLGPWLTPDSYVDIQTPIRVRRDRFLNRDDEFHKYLRLASSKAGSEGWVLILLDADDDCPAQLGPEITRRAQGPVGHERISVVLAKREYEAWFLASASSLDGARGFKLDGPLPDDPETPRDAKGWIEERMAGGTYREVTDQPAFSARMSLEIARTNSRSFRKLCRDWVKYGGSNDPTEGPPIG